MRSTFLFTLVMISIIGFSQSNYQKGYIIKNNSDTLRGEIELENEEALLKKIEFKNPDGTAAGFSPGDIKEFGFEDKKRFRVVNYKDALENFNPTTHFAKLLFEGLYTVYSFRKKQKQYFVVTDKDSSYFLYDDVMTNMGEMIGEGNYRGHLLSFAQGCPAVQADVDHTSFTEKSFVSFFSSIDKCRGVLDHSNSYFVKPKWEVNGLLSAGMMSFSQKSDFYVQGLVQFVFPTVQRRASVNTGFAYLRKTEEKSKVYSLSEVRNKHVMELYEIPFLFRYDILTTRIQPYFFAGTGVVYRKDHDITTMTSQFSSDTRSETEESMFTPTFIVSAGVNIRVVGGFFVDLNWRYDLDFHLPTVGVTVKIK